MSHVSEDDGGTHNQSNRVIAKFGQHHNN